MIGLKYKRRSWQRIYLLLGRLSGLALNRVWQRRLLSVCMRIAVIETIKANTYTMTKLVGALLLAMKMVSSIVPWTFYMPYSTLDTSFLPRLTVGGLVKRVLVQAMVIPNGIIKRLIHQWASTMTSRIATRHLWL